MDKVQNIGGVEDVCVYTYAHVFTADMRLCVKYSCIMYMHM